YHPLARPDQAVVRGQDAQGKPIAVGGTGYFARCLQHETDHLNGYLYIDRLSKRERKDVLRQMADSTPRYETVPNE
ncbi:peptide deformylase, partial [Streptomyces sp. NPDC006992]